MKSVKYTLDNYLYRGPLPGKRNEWIENIETTEILIRKKSLLSPGSALPLWFLFYTVSVTGILFFFSKAERANNENHSRLLTILSKQLGAEIEKRKKETELELLFSATSDGMAIVNTDGAYKKWTHLFVPLLAIRKKRADETKVQLVGVPRRSEDSKSEFKRYGGGWYRWYIRKQDCYQTGRSKMVGMGYQLWSLRKYCLVASARDVSEKKLAEQKLAAITIPCTRWKNKKILITHRILFQPSQKTDEFKI